MLSYHSPNFLCIIYDIKMFWKLFRNYLQCYKPFSRILVRRSIYWNCFKPKLISEISEVTINKCYKKLEKMTDDLVPSVILHKYTQFMYLGGDWRSLAGLGVYFNHYWKVPGLRFSKSFSGTNWKNSLNSWS